jgi:fanconi anemia group I protein
MLEYIAHLKELLDYFAFMNDKISTGLVSSILPLTKSSRDLKVVNLNSMFLWL